MGNSPWQKEKRRLKEDEAIAREQAERAAYWDRYNDLWNVPDRGKNAYMGMQDNFCAESVLEFVKVMLEPEEVSS